MTRSGLLCLGLFLGGFAYSQKPTRQPAPLVPPQDSRIQFIENHGQFEPQVAYMAEIGKGSRLWMEKDRLTYVLADFDGFHDRWHHRKPQDAVTVNAHAYQVKWVGANPNPRILAEGKAESYHNYFLGNDPSHWAGEVPLFSQLTYGNVWEGIDVKMYGKERAFRYDFEVGAGSDPGQIRLEYVGNEGLEVVDGKLQVKTSLWDVVEQAPRAWQTVNGQVVEVPVAFRLEGNEVRFDLGSYDSRLPLTIDPTLVFATYTGSTADNFGYTATYDDNGNAYAGGVVFGVGYPTSVGAFQVAFQGGGAGGAWTMNGGVDISLTKFNSTGTAILWSTYLGGSNNEQPHSLITNAAGELFVYGKTYSNNYPTTAGAYDQTYNGAADIVVTRLNAAGSNLVASTYIGGSGEDGTNIDNNFWGSSLKHNYGDESRGEIILDPGGNVYVASCSQSGNFPTMTPFQAGFGGGTQDAVVFRMTGGLNALSWSSYLGGSGNDAGYSIKLEASGSALVVGGTESPNFPTTPGTISPAYNGGIDGFIARISPAGNTISEATYIGTPNYDQTFFVEIDQAGDLYLYGQSLGPFPINGAVYSNPGGKQFIASIKPNFAGYNWSTVFGSGAGMVDISPTAFLVDICGFIYVCGWGGFDNFQGSTNNMALTPDAIQSTTDGSDFYLAVFRPAMTGLEYGTYLGGPLSAEHVDGGTSRFSKNLEVYHAVCGGCGGNSDFPTTPGCVSATNNSFNCNLAVFKFAFSPQTVISAFTSANVDSCAPFPVNFTNNSVGGVDYLWDFGDGSPVDTNFSPSHTYFVPGTYTVTLIAIDSNSCNISDTVTQTVTVYANPIATASGGGNICDGGTVALQATGGVSYVWSPAGSLSNPFISNPNASPSLSTTYSVIVTDAHGCVDTSYVNVFVSSFAADAGPPASFCQGAGGATLVAGSVSGGMAPYYYTWWCNQPICGLDSVFDNDPTALPTQTTTYYLQVTDATGCQSDIDSTVVTVLPVPIADAGPDQYICPVPSPGALLTGSFSNAPGPFLNVHWMPAAGLNDSTLLNPYARPDTTTIYTLVGTSVNGCTSMPTTTDTLATVTVTVYPRPIADAGPDQDLCEGDTARLQGIGYNAGPQYDFEWSPWNSLSDSTSSTPYANPTLTTEYILTVWSNGCPSYGDTVRIDVHTLPTLDAGPNRDMCLRDSVLLDAQAGGDSTATYTYLWTPSIFLNDPGLEDPTASPDTTRWYFVQATSTWGCKSPMDSVLVTLRPSPVAEAGPNQSICSGDTLSLLGSYAYTTTASATTPIFYSWTPISSLSNPSVAQPNAFPSVSTQYFLTVTNTICATTDSVYVLVNPSPGATLSADTTTACQGDSIALHATGGVGGASFTWWPTTGLSDPTSANPLAAPDSSTTYTLIVAEGFCADTLTLPISIIPNPNANFIHSLPEGCVPFQVNFLDNSDDTNSWVWNFGDGSGPSNQTNPNHTFTQAGTHTVTLISLNAGGCADTVTAEIIVHDTLQVDFTSDPLAPAEMTLPGSLVSFTDLTQGNPTRWVWNFGDGTSSDEQYPKHIFTEEGVYFVTLTAISEFGCQGTATQGPYLFHAPDLVIPNVFTPNGEINDLFLVKYTGNQPFSLKIYDRWGILMYESKDKTEGWDGKLKEIPVPEGVYYYVVQVGDRDFNGSLTLIR